MADEQPKGKTAQPRTTAPKATTAKPRAAAAKPKAAAAKPKSAVAKSRAGKGSDKINLTTLGVGAAIGSAAVAAALLYVNFNRNKTPEPSAPQDAEPTD